MLNCKLIQSNVRRIFFFQRLENVKQNWFDLQFLRSIKFWFGSKIHNSFWICKQKNNVFFTEMIRSKLLKYFLYYANLPNEKIPSRDILDKLDKYVPFFHWHTVKPQAVDCLG